MRHATNVLALVGLIIHVSARVVCKLQTMQLMLSNDEYSRLRSCCMTLLVLTILLSSLISS